MIDNYVAYFIEKINILGWIFIVCYKNTIVILNEWRAVDGF